MFRDYDSTVELPVDQRPGEVFFVYEEADGPEDCTEFEKFDRQRSVCYFECSDQNECDEISAKVDEALAALEEEYEDFSRDFR
ncbi:MAG TPA: hypothetical protein ENJ77_01115 [Candidatus Moranbacteria bacterium]|nr:hypothetical protein [Candidatus Moranbacteria bacterium]